MAIRGGSLMYYARNKYSQNGEDGIIAEVIRRLEIPSPGTFVEFGVGNGRDLSNTLALAEQGWRGVWIEQNEESFKKAKALGDTFGGRVETLYGTVGFGADDSLDRMLAASKMFPAPTYELPNYIGWDLDFMSIDIDSHDAEVWQAIKYYRARIVLIEINSTVPVGVEQLHGNGKEGNSFTTMMKIAKHKGYTLACHTGNLLFVDNALASKLKLPAEEYARPESIFNPMWAEWAAAARK